MRIHAGYLGLGSLVLVACGSGDVGTGARPLEAACVDAASVPAGGWVCGQSNVLECTSPSGANTDFIYVVSSTISGPSCLPGEVQVDNPGPYALGTHQITVLASSSSSAPGLELCTSELRVVDTTPPTIRAKPVTLWPPNHKMHRITVADCVEIEDACDSSVTAHFTFAASDEAVDGRGDGHHSPDITIGCDAVTVRAERQGGSNGRVYTLGVRATDDSGNTSEGTCLVTIAHDQSGRAAVQDAEAYRVSAPSCTAP